MEIKTSEDIELEVLDKRKSKNWVAVDDIKEAIKRIANNEHPEFSTGFATKLKKELRIE